MNYDGIRKYWNPFWDGSENDYSQTRVMNKLLIVASVFDTRKKMQFAKLCFEKLYGKDNLEFGLLSESISDILKSLYEEYNGFASNNSGSGGSLVALRNHKEHHLHSHRSKLEL